MNEYYSKEQLLECTKTAWQYDMYDLEDFLAGVPTADLVEVVRCRDCKDKDVCWQKIDCGYAYKEIVFCSCGERSDVE